jgi:hypothetical protein
LCINKQALFNSSISGAIHLEHELPSYGSPLTDDARIISQTLLKLDFADTLQINQVW